MQQETLNCPNSSLSFESDYNAKRSTKEGEKGKENHKKFKIFYAFLLVDTVTETDLSQVAPAIHITLIAEI